MEGTLRFESRRESKVREEPPRTPSSGVGRPLTGLDAATSSTDTAGGGIGALGTLRGRPWTTGTTLLPAGTGYDLKGRQTRSRGEPRPGMQDMVRIKNVLDIYKAVRILVGMIGNVWSQSNSTLACFRQVMPGLVRVRVGNDTYVVQGFLLQDLEPLCIRERPSSSGTGAGGPSAMVTDPNVVEVTCKHYTPYFRHIILLLKLRWLLRLHSACCELDYKMCSCSNLIRGLQYVALQQYAETEADSVFDSKVSQNVGSHVNMESVVDDLFDQLQRALGGGWRGFQEFVATCDPTRSLHHSRMDLAPAQVVSNSALMTVIDTIFVTCFLRASHRKAASDLRGCYDHIEMLGLPVPELPPLRGAANLRAWAKAKTKPTRYDRDKANKKDMEKLAQLDCVLLCAALELRLPEIMATEEEIADMNNVTTNLPKSMTGDVAPVPVDFGSTGRLDEGRPAARVILVDNPQVSPTIFSAVAHMLNHHMTFPAGIRERVYWLMVEAYGLSREQCERLAIAVTQNIDGKRLPTEKLLEMEEREKARIHAYAATFYKDCSHLLVPPLVASLEGKMKPAKYTEPISVAPRQPFASAFSAADMTRSLPDLRGFSVRNRRAGQDFKVPLVTGPLTMDPDLHRLRTTGFFIKMPPLGYT